MVVVNMSRSDERTQLADGRRDAAPDMRMAQVETHAYVLEVADSHDLEQVDRLGYLILKVFEQDLDSQRPGKGLQMLNRGHGMLQRSRAPTVLALAKVQNQMTQRHLFGGFQGSFDLIHGVDAPGLFGM